MRADATHRFEFEVDGGRRPPFVCLARTRAEAEQVARHARAKVRLRSQVPIAHADGDAAARQQLREQGLLGGPWHRDLLELMEVLDHVRLTGDAMSVVPVAFLPAAEILARGLRPCTCGKHGRHPSGLRPVEAPVAMSACMVDDGGWELHLWRRTKTGSRVEALEDWWRCSNDPDALTLHFRPASPTWIVAHRILTTLIAVADLRAGELSAVPVDPHGGHPA